MDRIENLIEIATEAIDDKRGEDISVLDVREKTSIADYFVIASGSSTIQVGAIAGEVEDKLFENGYEILNKNGYETSRWILLDYGDVIIHIFHKDERGYYDLERLWEYMKDDE